LCNRFFDIGQCNISLNPRTLFLNTSDRFKFRFWPDRCMEWVNTNSLGGSGNGIDLDFKTRIMVYKIGTVEHDSWTGAVQKRICVPFVIFYLNFHLAFVQAMWPFRDFYTIFKPFSCLLVEWYFDLWNLVLYFVHCLLAVVVKLLDENMSLCDYFQRSLVVIVQPVLDLLGGIQFIQILEASFFPLFQFDLDFLKFEHRPFFSEVLLVVCQKMLNLLESCFFSFL